MKKTHVILLIVLVVVAAVLGVIFGIVLNDKAPEEETEGKAIALLYDDQKNLAKLLGKKATTVEISDQVVTSKDVDGTADEAVLVYEDGTLYAVGTGTATLTVDGKAHAVTVSAAPISVFLITGHSIGYGQEGNGSQSVAIEPGQAYSSWGRDSLTSADGGIGYGAKFRAGGIDEHAINAFDEGQYGTRGVGSALAYNWNKLTGEKVWVMNLATPGSCINEWLPGVTGWHYDRYSSTKYTFKYESIQKHFGYLQTILSNEIAAGHYTLSHISMMYFSGANFQNACYMDWTYDSLKSDYAIFWEGIKRDTARDIDGDGKIDTFESIGIVPIWLPYNPTYQYDKLLNYYMAASADYPDVYIASDVYREWASGVLHTFPAIDYFTQGLRVAIPNAICNINMDPANGSPDSLFCVSDNVHLSQVGYNAVGLDMAANANSWYTATTNSINVQVRNLEGYAVSDTLVIKKGMTSEVMTPVIPAGARGNVTIETTDNLKISWPMYIEGVAVGTGTVKIIVDGVTVQTISVEVV